MALCCASLAELSPTARLRLAAAAGVVLWTVACRDRPRAPPSPGAAVALEAVGPRETAPASAVSEIPAAPEGAPESDPLAALSPPDQPVQRLAFSRGRLAWLDADELWVFELDGFGVASHFLARGARNVVGLTGGGFLIAGRDHVQRLSGAERRPELFPRAPRIGPTTVIPSRHDSEQFWLYYEGIVRLPLFDLGAPPLIASLPMLGWTELYEFDRRALLGLGDGSFVYTTLDGLRRIDVEGRREHLPSAELAGRVWALGRDARLDRVWAATEQHLYLLHVRERVETLRRFELPPHPVALAAEAGTAAVLSVARRTAAATFLRVDVYADGALTSRVVRCDAASPPAGDAGLEPRFEPELELSVADGLVAINAYGLQVFDYRWGVRKYLREAGAQKLAPRAP
jgi:hypothetical protein